METTRIMFGSGNYAVVAIVVLCGNDITVTIGGGTKPHVGAVAVAVPRASLKQNGELSATASVLCLLGHKDDMPARAAALRLASKLNTNVLVSVGLHVDEATPEEIKMLEKNFKLVLGLIEEWLEKKIF
ncbi:MAG: hypothetical protein RR384_04075 [Acidaminococcaceae bacterium]